MGGGGQETHRSQDLSTPPGGPSTQDREAEQGALLGAGQVRGTLNDG